MLQSHLKKKETKNEMARKVEAWKTLNSVLVKTNAEFMSTLTNMLTEKQATHEALKDKLEKGEGTEQENAEYIFLGGYIQCLKDITNGKSKLS